MEFWRLGRGLNIQPPWYKDHLAIKTTFAYSKRWSLYQGSTVYNIHKAVQNCELELMMRLNGLRQRIKNKLH